MRCGRLVDVDDGDASVERGAYGLADGGEGLDLFGDDGADGVLVENGHVRSVAEGFHAVVSFGQIVERGHTVEGIVAQGKFAREHKLFGFMETLWHHYRGQEFVEMMRLSAQAAWNGREPCGNIWCNPFATHWRQTGWDQGIRDWREHGYNDGQVTREILDR